MDKIGWYIFGSFCGFVGGVILGFAGWAFYFVPKMQAQQAEAVDAMQQLSQSPANVAALVDPAPCPEGDSRDMVGVWQGEFKNPERELHSRWKADYRDDGSFTIDFYDGQGEHTHTESGYWAYSACVIALLTTTVQGEQQLHQDLYRVNSFDGEHIRYAQFSTGLRFESKRLTP